MIERGGPPHTDFLTLTDPEGKKLEPADVKLARRNLSLWIVIRYLELAGDEQKVKDDYGLTDQEFDAAQRYYREHQPEVDAHIARYLEKFDSV